MAAAAEELDKGMSASWFSLVLNELCWQSTMHSGLRQRMVREKVHADARWQLVKELVG